MASNVSSLRDIPPKSDAQLLEEYFNWKPKSWVKCRCTVSERSLHDKGLCSESLKEKREYEEELGKELILNESMRRLKAQRDNMKTWLILLSIAVFVSAAKDYLSFLFL